MYQHARVQAGPCMVIRTSTIVPIRTCVHETVGKPPFNGANHVALLRNIERQEAVIPAALAKSLSTSCVSLLHGLLRRNPVERMTFEEFFTHPFLRSGSASPSSCNSSSSSSLVSSAEPSPVKGPTRCIAKHQLLWFCTHLYLGSKVLSRNVQLMG